MLGHAIRSLGPAHLSEVSARRIAALEKMAAEVRSRLQREINLWDTRAHALRERESAGQQTRLSAANATARAERLAERLQSRTAEIEKQKHIMSGPPMVRGGALVIPGGLLRHGGMAGEDGGGWTAADDAAAQALGLGRDRVEQLAMAAAMQAERALGRIPRDVSELRGIGYDIESRDPATGDLYFIEVKGRAVGSDQVTLTRTEMLCALNKPDHFRLVLVIIERDGPKPPLYVRRYDYGQPGFEQTHGTFPVAGLARRGEGPC